MTRFIQWWHDNPDKADEIRARRRRRLQENPEAAEAHRQRCREYYRRRKAQITEQAGPRGHNKPKSFWINGEPVLHWGTGQTSAELGVTPATLRDWEERGVLPIEAILVDAVRRRWWPAAFITSIKPLVNAYHENQIPSLRYLAGRVSNEWDSYKRQHHDAHATRDDDLCQPDDQEAG